MIPTKEEMDAALSERHSKFLQEKFAAGRVAVAGLGGLGSHIAVALARAGVGHLHLVDFDQVDLSNLNRQQYRIRDIGRYKTQALREILQEINPYLEIRTDTVKVTPYNVKELFSQEMILCEAFDQAKEKAMLVDAFFTAFPQEADKILIAGSGMAGCKSSNMITTRRMNSRFYLCGDGQNGLETGQHLMAPRVSICAGHEANMVLRMLAGEQDA